MRAFFKDPLAHFLAAGAVLFLIGTAAKPPAPEDNRIVADRAALLEFIQYRSRAFEPNAAAAMLDGMTDAERAELVRDYIREEALAREAKKLGLDANDYVIRQRMVQKAEFLAEAAAETIAPAAAEVSAYYTANRDRYTSPPSATLTHVFISIDRKPADAARNEANALLAELKRRNAGFNDATAYGDRFLFHKNYVDRTDEYIASQLGEEVRRAVFSSSPPLDAWTGPYRSEYGFHLVYVSSVSPARLAPLEEIRDLVASELAEEMRQRAIDAAIDAVISGYEIEIPDDAGA